MVNKYLFSKDQFRVALRIYSQSNYLLVKKYLRGGPVKRALALLIKAGNQL